MGWKLKALAALLAIILFPFAWFVSILLLVYVFSGFFLRRQKQQPVVVQVVSGQPGAGPQYTNQPVQVVSPPQPTGPRYAGMSLARYALAGLFFFLAIAAVSERGTLSPLVFGAIGVVTLAWTPFAKLIQISVLTPVDDSILLRSRIPFLWVSLAEVKLATQQPARPISSIRERILVFASDGPSMYLVVRGFAARHRRAEEKVLLRMREIEKAMAPLGAYLMPLDSSRAAEKLTISLKDVGIDPEKWKQNLSSVHYDVLVIKPREGCVRSFAAYVKDGRSPGKKPRLPHVGRNPARPPLLWEVLYQVGMRVRWSSPDAYTAFLSSMEATEDAAVGERITNMGPPDEPTVHVRALGSPTVELSRPQLRAIVRIYSPPVKEGALQALIEGIHP